MSIPSAPAGLRLQSIPGPGPGATHRRRLWRLTALHLLILAAGVLSALWAYRFFQPAVFTHPGFDPAALTGTPEVDGRYGYSSLTVAEGYVVALCGVPANDSRTVELFFTNPPDNQVWLRAELLDQEGVLLASTGVLRQGEYLPSLVLDRPLTARETPVTLRVVAYEPDTWRSRGNVKLNMTLYLNFR